MKYVWVKENTSIDKCTVNYLPMTELGSALEKKVFIQATEILIANVQKPQLSMMIAKWAKAQGIRFIEAKSQFERHGIKSCYQQKEALGADRWLAMLGAKVRFKDENVLIVDAGTATTIDLLARDGQHQGGWIIPGIDTLYSSLLHNTENVNAKLLELPKIVLGENTTQCVNYGCWAMTVGAINEAINFANSLLTIDNIIIAGGNGEKISTLMSVNVNYDPFLVFRGLLALSKGN